MKPMSLANGRSARLAALALVIFGFFFSFTGVAATAAPLAQDPQVGPVEVMALDAAGNGWAWAYPKRQGETASYLLRIENGKWRIYTDPVVLMPPPGVIITSMKLAAPGDDGWATGYIAGPEGDAAQPILWRLREGKWQGVIEQLPEVPGAANDPVTSLHSVTLSADGREGWLVAITREANFILMHLRNGRWSIAPQPAHSSIFDVAVSPDGKSGWGWGLSPEVEIGNAAFQLENGNWQTVPGEVFPPTHTATDITVDDAGNGWILSNHFRSISSSVFTRLRPGFPPEQLDVELPFENLGEFPYYVLSALAVDPFGRGWAAGWVSQGEGQNARDLPVLVRLADNTVTYVPFEAFGVTAQQIRLSRALAMNAEGTHLWLSWTDENNYGHLAELREYWPHAQPAAAAPLQGGGRCFAEVRYCLRGVFADFWAKNGGLGQLGYPLTPEVQEKIGDKTYVVQYTQRARLEHHTEFAGTPNEVLLGLLGNSLVRGRLNEDPFTVKEPIGCAGCQWFFETEHNVVAPILPYWENNGGIRVFGLPRSEAFREKNAADGGTYLVQYFERNRIEHHPEHAGTPFQFLLGLLGVEQFKQTYGYVP